eukprot:maker-scaffold1323_size47899-snap-gene-0.10 protein:Tk03418 transcript:maker-scaffold1323_size47899-snap-gene-0.10-mRNA-1 annotation:"hypothetical protein CAPTEDRAFT_218855"
MSNPFQSIAMGPSAGESYHLLNLSPSEEDEEQTLPDLNLTPPPKSLNIQQKVKRKIRLKRRDRDQSTHRLTPGGQLSGLGSSSSYACSSISLIGMIVVAIAAFVVLAFFTAQIHVTVSNLGLEMEKVSENRNDLMKRYVQLQTQNEGLALSLEKSLTRVERLENRAGAFDSQIVALNESTRRVEDSLETAPELRELPRRVRSIEVEMAKFGSRLTEMESQAHQEKRAAAIAPFRADVPWQAQVASLQNETKSLNRSLWGLEDRFRTVGSRMASQLKRDEERSEKMWVNLGDFRVKLETMQRKVSQLSELTASSIPPTSSPSSGAEPATSVASNNGPHSSEPSDLTPSHL